MWYVVTMVYLKSDNFIVTRFWLHIISVNVLNKYIVILTLLCSIDSDYVKLKTNPNLMPKVKITYQIQCNKIFVEKTSVHII